MPIEDAIQAFEALAKHAGNEEQIILDYFESNYTGELHPERRFQPLLPHTLWNMNIKFQEYLPPAINDLEGGTITLLMNFAFIKPLYRNSLKKLKEDSPLYHQQMAQKIIGAANSPQRCAYWELNDQI